ncbi:lysine transporter LysE [Ottowia sp. GY511]|uniref:LysE family transporter n=1 Tax=Ottowia flava TaxID=2675430 RepID=A0ABW4KZ32_9BURK|nr:LysE family transporter [Ottowia sp. GY511]TXK28531.1 lysine transporter LysE [Ottowia sp. GY511]
MFGIQDYWAFVVAVVVFLAIPGPGNFAVITSTSKGGLRGGAAATLGIILGDQALYWLAVAGVAALLKANPSVFAAVQYAGAAYLAWLGFQMLRTRPGSAPPITIHPRQYLRQALLITLLNPKAIVFYMAFVPLFIDPARQPGLTTFAVLAATIAALTLAYCMSVALITHFAAARLRSNPRTAVWLNRMAGSILLAFGLKLAIQK